MLVEWKDAANAQDQCWTPIRYFPSSIVDCKMNSSFPQTPDTCCYSCNDSQSRVLSPLSGLNEPPSHPQAAVDRKRLAHTTTCAPKSKSLWALKDHTWVSLLPASPTTFPAAIFNLARFPVHNFPLFYPCTLYLAPLGMRCK